MHTLNKKTNKKQQPNLNPIYDKLVQKDMENMVMLHPKFSEKS